MPCAMTRLATATVPCPCSCCVWTSTPPGPTWQLLERQEAQWPFGTSGSSQHPWPSQDHGQQLGMCARWVVVGCQLEHALQKQSSIPGCMLCGCTQPSCWCFDSVDTECAMDCLPPTALALVRIFSSLAAPALTLPCLLHEICLPSSTSSLATSGSNCCLPGDPAVHAVVAPFASWSIHCSLLSCC